MLNSTIVNAAMQKYAAAAHYAVKKLDDALDKKTNADLPPVWAGGYPIRWVAANRNRIGNWVDEKANQVFDSTVEAVKNSPDYIPYKMPITGWKVPLIRPIDFSGTGKSNRTDFKPLPETSMWPGKQLRNVVGWLQHNAKAGINRAFDAYTNAGGIDSATAQARPEYQAYQKWLKSRNSMPTSFYEGRIPQTQNARPNGPYLNSDLKP